MPDMGSVIGSASSSLPQVVMMQTADSRYLNHLPPFRRLHRPRDRTVVGKRSVGTDVVVIFAVGFENLLQLSFMEYHHSIQAFSPNGTDQALDDGILPRRSRGDQLLLDAHALDPLHEDRAVDRIAVPQQILGRGVVGEGLDDLLRGLRCRW